MKLGSQEFRTWDQKAITLLGMSGVGKTRLACILRKHLWFHYSGDYRIGTRYLDEPILDNIKQQVMQIPFLRELLRSDSIRIDNKITFNNLQLVSSFLGEIGNPQKGGIGLREFRRRQKLHHDAEIAAMKDVPVFIRKAHDIYGYEHFVNDAGGSLCELDDPDVMEILSRHTLILYIKATEKDERELILRAEEDPKPLYYREDFLDDQLAIYMNERNLDYAALIDPDDFVCWIFSRLFYYRIPLYEAIARRYGYTITTDDVATVHSEKEFLAVVEQALDQQN